MTMRPPIDTLFTPLDWDKFNVVRPLNIDPSGQPHTGVDLRPHENGGTKFVFAAENGKITYSTANQGSYYVIEHEDGFETLYVHMAARPLLVGAKVKKGDVLGRYSDSANHLHFAVKKDGKYVDPQSLINFDQTTSNPSMSDELKIHTIKAIRNYYDLSSGQMQGGMNFTDLETLINEDHPDQAFAKVFDFTREQKKQKEALISERNNLWAEIESLKSQNKKLLERNK